MSTSSGRYVAQGEWMGGTAFDMGPTAVLRVGGVDVIVTSVATPPFHREQITSQGLSPAGFRIVAAKGALAWQDGLADIADGAVFLDTKGSTPARPESLERTASPESGGDWSYPAN
jgi:microcystin degradation protein MlrC